MEYKEIKAQLYDKRDTFPFFVVHIPYLEINIPSNIYYASIGSEILNFARTTSHINTFVTLSNRLLKRMQKQGNKRRSITTIANKYSVVNISLFSTFLQTTANFFHCYSQNSFFFHCLELELYIYMFACYLVWFCCLVLCFFVCLFICLFVCYACLIVCLFVWLL